MITMIVLPVQREETLFEGGPTEAERAALDIPASIERFNNRWREEVARRYPSAKVRLSLNAERVCIGGPGYPGEGDYPGVDLYRIEHAGYALWEEDEDWLVVRGSLAQA